MTKKPIDKIELGIVVSILGCKTLAAAEGIVARASKSHPKHPVFAWARAFIALRPGDGRLIDQLAQEAVEMLARARTPVSSSQWLARLRVWQLVSVGEIPSYGVDLFATAEKHWKSQLSAIEIDDRVAAHRQGASPVVQVFLQENAVEAAEAAIDALVDANVFPDMPAWLTKRWIVERVFALIDLDGPRAREAAREVAAALADAGKVELSLCWQLLGATPRNQMAWWPIYPAVASMHRLGLLGELSADEAKQMDQAINVLQMCAEGVFVSETKSLWEILRPMLRDEEDELPEIRRPSPLPRPRVTFAMSGPSVVVLPSAPKMKSEAKEYEALVGADVPLVVARGVLGVRPTLRAEYPHALSAIDLLLRDVVDGKPVVVKPVLLVGPPGTGKSRLARRFAELLGLYSLRFDAAASTDGQFAGVSKGWYTTMPSAPMRAIQQGGKANPVVLLDEIEKAGTSNHNGSLFSSLTAFLERETSRRYRDQSLDAECDLSFCSYIATANDDTLLPPHIRDRFRVVRVELPTLAHLPLLARNVVADIEKADGIEGFVEPLAEDELQVIGTAWKRAKFSMRALQKIIQATLDARAACMMRH